MKLWIAAAIVALAAVALIAFGEFDPDGEVVGKPAPELDSPGPWINSQPLKLADLRGKVVLLDIFEYTCVNCIRTIPYLQQWYKKYGPQGLVIIGVHDPEFDFSRVPANVKKGTENLGITWPVVVDNDYKIWSSFHNSYWPRKFLIDAKGIVRYDHIGEGGYERTEEEIRQLLMEANPGFAAPSASLKWAREEDKPGAVCYPQTAETYANSERGVFASGMMDAVSSYKDPGDAGDGQVALQGKFKVTPDATDHIGNTPGRFDDYVGLKFHATEANVVFGYASGASKGSGYRVRVTLDNAPVASNMRGADLRTDKDGSTYLNVTDGRMYKVVEGQKYGTYVLKLYTDSNKFALYAYTFGSCLRPENSQ